MSRLLIAMLSLIVALSTAAHAGDRKYLGHGHLLTNDVFGDGRDRWRTGSFAGSWLWGPALKEGKLPSGFGEIIELRFNGEIVSPESLSNPRAGDRPYAGTLSLGLHTHFRSGQTDFAVGADLVFVGPQTDLDDFQDFLHDNLGGAEQSDTVLDAQIRNNVYPTVVAEAGRDIAIGNNVMLRPYVEGRAGIETLARVGVDLTIGKIGRGDIFLRDPVTGQRYRVITEPVASAAFVVGADIAYVDSSQLLPASAGVNVTEMRNRVRAGIHLQNKKGSSLFYGLTWLDEEFEAQNGSQIVGSIRLRIKF